jgi:hypothetical protein
MQQPRCCRIHQTPTDDRRRCSEAKSAEDRRLAYQSAVCHQETCLYVTICFRPKTRTTPNLCFSKCSLHKHYNLSMGIHRPRLSSIQCFFALYPGDSRRRLRRRQHIHCTFYSSSNHPPYFPKTTNLSKTQTYRNSLIIAVLGVPGCLLGGLLVETPFVGRKGTLAASTTLTGVFLFCSTTALDSNSLLGWNCAYNFMSNIMYAVLYAYVTLHPPFFSTYLNLRICMHMSQRLILYAISDTHQRYSRQRTGARGMPSQRVRIECLVSWRRLWPCLRICRQVRPSM